MNTEEIKKDLILELIHIIEKPEDSNKAWKDAIIVSAKEYLQSLESEETKCKNCDDKGCNYCYDYGIID